MDTEKKEMMEKKLMNARRPKPTAKEKENIVRGEIKKAFEGMKVGIEKTGTVTQKKTPIKKTVEPKGNNLLSNPNITITETKKIIEGIPNLKKMVELANVKNETEKHLEQQGKAQKNKTFSEMISGMKLGPGTISNRTEMSDKSIYENFKKELAGIPFKVGSIFKIGKDSKEENFKILGIKETDSGVKAVVLGNENTKEVEIIFEGSNPGFGEIAKNPKAWIRDWSNNARNLDTKRISMARKIYNMSTGSAGRLIENVEKSMDNLTAKYSKGSEVGTPKSYEDALKIAKEVQEEYKNGKGGYTKGLIRVSGHSKGGGEAIYTASHLNLEAIVADPAPVNNPGKYLYNNKILVVEPNNGLLNRTKKNSAGAVNPLPKFSIIGIGEKMENLPAIIVGAYKDEKKGGKLDNHKTDPESVKKAEDELLKNIRSNSQPIKGEKNVRSR